MIQERTFRATRAVIEYREARPVVAKGKKEPVPVWEAVAARVAGDVAHEVRAVLVGRGRELGELADALARVRADRSPQLVMLEGVPGIGKSRLVYELRRIADAEPELIYWRQGRSLPYGDGISFWALAEMVKAQARISDNDTTGEAEAKLAAMVAEVLGGAAESGWIAGHLGALVGVGKGAAGGGRRDEIFAAWRQFFEALSKSRMAPQGVRQQADSAPARRKNFSGFPAGLPPVCWPSCPLGAPSRSSAWGPGQRGFRDGAATMITPPGSH